MPDTYYESVRQQIADALSGNASDKEGIFWSVMDGVAAVIDGATGVPVAGPINNALQGIRKGIIAKGGKKSIITTPNPWFVFNGHDQPDNAVTKKYMHGRTLKSIGGAAIALTGGALSGVTQVDVGGILQHGNATGSTLAHIVKLKGLAGKTRQSKTITAWLDVLIMMKGLKTAVRGAQLVTSCIPVPAAGMVGGLLGAAAKIGIKLTTTKVCLAVSADLHWRAYQEQVISRAMGGGTGKIGPASNILYELFTRRGATRIFGKYDVDGLIKESCGWMAVSDKIMMI